MTLTKRGKINIYLKIRSEFELQCGSAGRQSKSKQFNFNIISFKFSEFSNFKIMLLLRKYPGNKTIFRTSRALFATSKSSGNLGPEHYCMENVK